MMARTLIVTVVLTLLAAGAFAAQTTLTDKAGEYTVSATFQKSGPAVGGNDLLITVKDPSGKEVTDAKIAIEYFMTQKQSATQKSLEMPYHGGKAGGDITTGGYRTKLDITMPGPWNLVVKLTRAGKTETARLHLNVK
jgi:hypothetical protein